MKKGLFSLLLILCSTFLAAQRIKPPFPDCKDMKEKISAIKKSFDKILETFKNKETGKAGVETIYSTETIYSSDFNLCGENGVISQRQAKGKTWHEVSFKFSFDKNKYDISDREAFSKRGNEIPAIIRNVFVKWHEDYSYDDEDEDNEGRHSTFYTFSEENHLKGVDVKKEVKFSLFYDGKYNYVYRLEFTLFQH